MACHISAILQSGSRDTGVTPWELNYLKTCFTHPMHYIPELAVWQRELPFVNSEDAHGLVVLEHPTHLVGRIPDPGQHPPTSTPASLR